MFMPLVAIALLVSQAPFLQAAVQVPVFDALEPMTFDQLELPLGPAKDLGFCAYSFEIDLDFPGNLLRMDGIDGESNGETRSYGRPKIEDFDAIDVRLPSGEVLIEQRAWKPFLYSR